MRKARRERYAAHPFGGEFGVFDFFEAFVSDLREPAFERLVFGRWDRLDDSQELFGIRHIGEALLAVGGGHFQSVTFCNGFTALVREAFLHHPPIDLRIVAISEHSDDIHDGEIPFCLGLVPSAADLFLFKEGDGAHGQGW